VGRDGGRLAAVDGALEVGHSAADGSLPAGEGDRLLGVAFQQNNIVNLRYVICTVPQLLTLTFLEQITSFINYVLNQKSLRTLSKSRPKGHRFKEAFMNSLNNYYLVYLGAS
jgi:hypothetical protein